MADLSPIKDRLILHRSQSYIETTESATSCNSYGAGLGSRTLRAAELALASNARDDLRHHWKILPHSHAAKEGRKLFVGGIPKLEDDCDAVLQICRIFLHEGIDLKHVKLLRGSARGQCSPNSDEFHYAFVDLMHKCDATTALQKLDGAVRLDDELLISIAGLTKELMVGPLPGYQPRRKQVTEIRKLFKGHMVGEISLFYQLEPSPAAPGEELFESKPKAPLYFCAVRLADTEDAEVVISKLHKTIWAGRQIFVRHPKVVVDSTSRDSVSSHSS